VPDARQWHVLITAEAKRHLAQITDLRIRTVVRDALFGLRIEPERQGKPLTGDLDGYRSLRVVGQRYRILFKPEGEKVTVYVVAVGLRKEGDKADIYQVAQKLLKTYKAKHAQRRAPSAPDASTQT
jgi:mRNA interferase RelE/StbE